MHGDDLMQAMQHEAARLARRPMDMVQPQAQHAGRALLAAVDAYRTFADALAAVRPIGRK